MTKLKRTISKGKIGYRNEDYKLVIPCQYDEGVEFFGDVNSYQCKCKYGLVVSKGCCGMIDVEGNVVVPIEYEDVRYLFEDLFAVRKSIGGGDWLIGVININGDIVIPFEYKAVSITGNFIKCWKFASSSRCSKSHVLGYNNVVYDYSYFEHCVWYNKHGVEICPGVVKEGVGDVLITEENNKFSVKNEIGEKILSNEYDAIECPCEDLFIVRVDGEKFNRYGVVSKYGEIIPVEYAYIEYGRCRFFKCYTDCDTECKYLKSPEYLNEIKNKVLPLWFNDDGKEIYTGNARPLNESLLVVERTMDRGVRSYHKNRKWGVYTKGGEKLLNFIYDDIISVQGKIAVAKDGLVGLLDSDGTVIINPSYKSIECVSSDEGIYTSSGRGKTYGMYSKQNPFSTEQLGKSLEHIELRYGESVFSIEPHLLISSPKRFDFNKYFILRTETYEELFSIENGIVAYSRYQQILQITDEYFAVRSGSAWGVFRGDDEELVIPCKYDQIYYESGNVVYLQKDGLWGAKSLNYSCSDTPNPSYVDIPIKYLEIKQLSSSPIQYYGVKHRVKQRDNSELEAYTILDQYGVELPIMQDFDLITSQFNYYRRDRVLCSINNKFGFISLDGYIAIPFKYDEISGYSSGNFLVRVGDAWGKLSLDRGEIIPVKYGSFFRNQLDDACAYDAITKRVGILNPDGTERIPSIYEYIEPIGDYYLFGVGVRYYGGDIDGYDDVDWDNCGCLDKNGNVIILPKYKSIEVGGGYIFARRQVSESIDYDDDCWYKNSLVYDLYNSSGELLVGGFSKYEVYAKQKLFKLFYGGKWKIKRESRYVGGEYDIDETEYFDDNCGRWLVVNDRLRSVKNTEDGGNYYFNEASVIKVITSKEGENISYVENCPVDVLFDNEPQVCDRYVIYLSKGKYRVIRTCDSMESVPYDLLSYIGGGRFFVKVDGKVGVVNFDGSEILPINYLAFTYPKGGFSYGILETSPGKCKVVLYDFNENDIKEYVAVAEKGINEVRHSLRWGSYMIKVINGRKGLKSIISYDRSEFGESFQEMISQFHERRNGYNEPGCYWFEGKWNLIPEDSCDDIDNYDDYGTDGDYLRDSWDAMTDGMCGDMDDGFDGDYSFLGRG